MSTQAASSRTTFSDSSNLESRRHDFRRLLTITLACVAASWLASFIAPVSEQVQRVSNAEIESIPEWRYWTGMAATLGLIVCGLWGLYRLWTLKSDGVGYLVFAMFFPMFLWVPVSAVSSPLGSYVDSISLMVSGMLLFACWSNRDIFEHAPESTPAVAGESTPPAGHTAS